MRAIDRRLLPFDGVRVGARHDHELRVGAPVDGGLDAIDHLLGRDERLARPVAAALGLHLVFEVAAAPAPDLTRSRDRARDVERRAPAGVGVDQQRQVGRRGDAPDVLADVVEAGDAEVRQPERGVGDAGARQVDGAEAGPLRQQRRVGVDGADDLQRVLGGQGRTQPRAGGDGGRDSGHGSSGVAAGQGASLLHRAVASACKKGRINLRKSANLQICKCVTSSLSAPRSVPCGNSRA